jgi:peptidoglycan/LPS O-acetylase OafA/YrhL
VNQTVIREKQALPLNLSGRVPELDGIRGIAIGMVVLYHYFGLSVVTTPGSSWAYIQAGGRLAWTGVDLFFVLSGFLIGGILIDARESSNYFKVFYIRRFYRILPLYAVWFCGVQLMLLAIRLGVATKSCWFLEDHLPSWTYTVFLQNFWMAAANNIGGPTSGGTWSLAIEEQFYLTLPMIIWFVDVKRRKFVILAGIAGAPILRALCFAYFSTPEVAACVLMPCRADALLFGVLGAILWRDEQWKSRLQANPRFLQFLLIILIAGAGVLTIYMRVLGKFWLWTIGLTWMAALYLCFLLCAITQQDSRLSACLRWKWLTGLGTIAYGVYLFHWYVRAFLYQVIWSSDSKQITTVGQFVATLVAIPITVLLCRLSYVYFERPLLRVGHRLKYE